MRGPAAILLALFALISLSSSNAQELARTFCEDTPANQCPGVDCLCVDDALEIVFEPNTTMSIFEYGRFEPGLRVPSAVVLNVTTTEIRGFSFGVAHQESVLNLDMRDLHVPLCDPQAIPGQHVCAQLVPGGYTVVVLPSFDTPVVLPVRRVPLATATYTLTQDVGTDGTVLSFSESLGDPPIPVAFTVDELTFPEMVDGDERNCINNIDDDGDGLTDRNDPDCVVRGGAPRKPRILIDGLIRRRATAPAPFRRGDADGNGKLNITDAILVIQIVLGNLEPRFRCDDLLDTTDDGRLDIADGIPLLRLLFQGGPALPEPFGSCDNDPTLEALECTQSNCQPP